MPDSVDDLFPAPPGYNEARASAEQSKQDALPSTDDLFPANVEKQYQSGLIHDPVQDWIFSSDREPASKVLDVFGEGFQEQWGQRELGLSDESKEQLKKIGGSVDDYLENQGPLVKAANQLFIRPAARNLAKTMDSTATDWHALNAAMAGTFRGLQAAAQYQGERLGLPSGLVRDITALPEAFPAGKIELNIGGTAIPEAIAATRRSATAVLESSRAMGVIGPGDWSGKGPVQPITEAVAKPPEVPISAAQEGSAVQHPQAEPPIGEVMAKASPDVATEARASAPKVFEAYDALNSEAAALRSALAEQGKAQATGMHQPFAPADVLQNRLAELNTQIDALAPQVRQAYQDAADQVGQAAVTSEPQFGTMAQMLAERGQVVPLRPIEAQRATIAGDVEQQLVAAGRPQQEAASAGRLYAARYEAMAAHFNGALGQPEALYREIGPQFEGGERGRRLRAVPSAEAAPAGAAEAAAAPAEAPRGAGAVHAEGGAPARLAGEEGAAAEIGVDATHDVVTGANSGKASGTVYIDRHIPELSPNLKDADGNPVNLWNLLQLHERTEADLMARGMPYQQAHLRATDAERTLATRTGINFDAYTKEMDGYLSQIEHEGSVKPPKEELHVDPDVALGKHTSAAKQLPKAEAARGPVEAFAPVVAQYEKSGMIEKAEALKDAKKRRADKGYGGGTIEVFKSAHAEAEAHGMSIGQVNAERAALEEERGAKLDAALGEVGMRPGDISAGERAATLELMINRGYEDPIKALDLVRLKDVAEGREIEHLDAVAAAQGVVRHEEFHDDNDLEVPFDREPGIRGEGAPREGEQAQGTAAQGEGARGAGETEREYEQRRGAPRELNSPEYQAAMAAHNEASRRFSEAQAEYRSRSDTNFDRATAKFLEARKAWDEATKTYDVAYAQEQSRKIERTNLASQREGEGQQTLFDRITQAELVQRRANEPLKPSVEQKPMDEGLFGDTKNQRELFQTRRPYENVPDSLMGFRREGPTKPYEEQGFRHEQPVKVSFPDGQTFYDAVKGLNEPHALERARRNWPGAEIEAAQWSDLGDAYFQGRQGSATFRPGERPIIRLLQGKADASTIIHESGHVFLEEMKTFAAHPAAPDVLKADWQTTQDWLGVKPGEDLTTRQHERFARGFEQYLREGVAPSPELANVFARFRDWLVRIYTSLKGLGQEISPEMRDVFDRMLAEKPKRTVIADLAKEPSLADIHASDAELTPPHFAEGAADRAVNEAAKERQELPEAIADEHAAVAAEIGTRPEEPPTLESGSGAPESLPTRAASGAAPVVEREGGGEPVHEGAQVGREPAAAPARAEIAGKPAGEIKPAAIGPHLPFDELPTEEMDKVGNIRLENLNTPADVNDAIRELYKANHERLDRATRGVVTDQQVVDLADSMGTDPALVANNMKRLRAMTVEDHVPLAARIWLLRDMFTKLATQTRQAIEGGDAGAFVEAQDRFLMVHETVTGVTAEMGRGLRAFRNMKGMDDTALAEYLTANKGKTLFQIRQEMALGRATNTPAQMARGIQEAAAGWSEKVKNGVVSYQTNNLLSGPITHIAYTTAIQLGGLFRASVLTPASIAMQRLLEIGGKTIPASERMYLGEAMAQLHGLYHGTIDGIIPAYSALKSGITIMAGDPAGKDLFSNNLMYRPQAIPGRIGYAMETPWRMVAALHTLNYAGRFQQDLAGLSFRDAMGAGLDPASDAFATHMAQFRDKPPEWAMSQAHDTALNEMMMQRPAYGTAQWKVQQALHGTFLGRLAFPFVQLGMNMMGKAGEFLPGYVPARIRADLMGRNGAGPQSMQMAKWSVGTGIILGTIGWTASGNLSGGGPADSKQRETLEMTGWKPYSVRVGNVWYPYRKWLGYLGPLVGGAADLYEVGHEWHENGIAAAAKNLGFGAMEVVGDETWMRQFANFAQLARGEQSFEKFARNTSMDFLPFSVGMGQIASLIDPTWREVRSEMDALRAHIPFGPFGHSSLYPVNDVWGNPMHGGTAVSPSWAVNDAATNALIKAELWPARMERKIKGVELSEQQYFEMTRDAGRAAKMRADALVANPNFQRHPQGVQKEELETIIKGARSRAESAMQMKIQGLINAQTALKWKQLHQQTVH